MAEGKPAGVAAVYAYFAGNGKEKPTADQKKAYPLARFRSEWEELPPASKTHFSVGIGNGTFTY